MKVAKNKRDETAAKNKRDETAAKNKRDEPAVRNKRDEAAVKSKRDEAAVKSKRDEAAGKNARDETAVARFVERFAANLEEAGVPRMPARVFAALLATDAGSLTAAELAARLQASPAAISGAVRYLQQVSLVGREREPGSRRDRYRVWDDAWYEAVVRRERLLLLWEDSVRDGVAALGRDTPAGARLAESADFFAFLREEMPAMLERWRYRRAAQPRREGG